MALSPRVEAALRYLARSWQSEDGLPSNVVRAVAQSTDGYLWVGTAEGVVRFDGRRFTALQHEGDAKLARRPIRALFPLANGEVWVTTASNVLLRGRGSRLEEIRLPATVEAAAAASAIHQVVLDSTGDVLIARGEEIWQVVRDKSARRAARSPALEKLLQQDAANEAERGRPAPGETKLRLRSSQGALWQFTPEDGLTITDHAGRTVPVSLQTEAPSTVQAMFEDREGNVWLATHSQGLWRLRASRVEMLTMAEGLSDRAALLVLEDRSRALWVAPQAGGLDRLGPCDVQHFELGTGTIRRAVSALLETKAGALWAATRDGQVHGWKDGAFSPAFPNDRRANKVGAMAEDDRGRVWFGGRSGLVVWDGSELQSVNLGARETVNALASAGSTIWIGMESGRVFRGSSENLKATFVADAFARQPISGLLPDTDGSLWVSTTGAGLFRLHHGKVASLVPRMSEADPRITCLLDDGRGFLWMGTLGGICRAEKTKLLENSASADHAALILDRSDGLLTRECTRSGQPSGWRGQNGALYFSTGHGVARVHPERLALNTLPPPVVIELIKTSGRVLPIQGGRVQTGPGRSRLEFNFTALTFMAPEKVRFRARLEGLDEAWRDLGNQRAVAYEAVPPGQYRFHVIAENGDGIWNETGAFLAAEVLPHFWETRWFQATVAALAAAMAVGIGALVMRARLRERMLRLEAQTSREKERARIAQDLHDDLGASLTEISLLANLAAEERQPGSPEDGTLPEVAAKAQALVGALDVIVWAVNPRHDTLRSLAEYLAAFGGKFLQRAGITLRRDVPRDLPEVSLDAERRHNVFLAAREALNNAVKHSSASEVWLRLRVEGEALELCIEDNGRGFSSNTDELSEGFRGMRARMGQIGGACRIESDSKGTRVCFSLPLAPA